MKKGGNFVGSKKITIIKRMLRTKQEESMKNILKKGILSFGVMLFLFLIGNNHAYAKIYDVFSYIDIAKHNNVSVYLESGDFKLPYYTFYDSEIDGDVWSDYRWSISNKSIASGACDYGWDEYTVDVKKPGKFVVKTKKNSCTVKVVARNGLQFNFAADGGTGAYSINLRKNVFKVKIANYSKKSITILKSGASAKHEDYKSLDYKLKLSKNVTIKPYQTKTISFKANKQIAYDDDTAWTIYYKIKYKGKTYKAKDDYIRIGKKWKYPYKVKW